MTKTVMRVDEILYSTARSQAEYEDLSTLASRLTDAVDSIVARNEEGEEIEGRRLLPCVKAALTIAQQPLASPINRNNRTYAASRNSLREIRPREQSQNSRLMGESTGTDEWFDRNGEGTELGFKAEAPQLWQSAAERPLLGDSFGNRVQTRSYGQQGGMLNQPSNGSLMFRGDLNQPSAGPLGDPLLQTVWPPPKQSSRPTPTEIAFLLPLSLPGSSDAAQGTGPRRSSSREEATLGESMDPQQSSVWEGIGRKGGSKWDASPWQGQRVKDSEDPPTKRARQEPTCL